MNLTQNRSPVFYILLIALQGLIFGFGNAVVKFAYESITPLWLMAIRFTLASLLFLPFFGKSTVKELRTAKLRQWVPTAICMATAYISCNVALNLTTATNVGFLMSLAVVFTSPLAYFVLGRKIHRNFIFVLISAVIGLFLISNNSGTFCFGAGEALAILCSVAMAGSLVWGEQSLEHFSAGSLSLIQLAVAALGSFLCALIWEEPLILSNVEPVARWIILYLTLFCACLCYILQNISLAYIPSAIVSLTQCLEPVFTAVFAFIILGERLSVQGICGAVILIFCIIYGNFYEIRHGSK